MRTIIIRFVNNQSGATSIEYGLIASIIAIAIITALNRVGGNLSKTFSNIGNNLKGS